MQPASVRSVKCNPPLPPGDELLLQEIGHNGDHLMTALIVALATWSVLAFSLLLFVAQFLAHEAGVWFGRRGATHGEVQPEKIGVVVGGMLGLLAFVLALTLSFANTRFTERRDGTLAEANAIGTAWLRAEAIGHPRGAEIARLLEQYTQVRRQFVLADNDPGVLGALNQQTNALQSAIWGHASAIVRERPDPVATSLMAALNDTFDMTTAERFAFSLRLPPQIFWLLIGMTMLSMATLGYQFGVRGRPLRILVALLTLMWTVVIVDILDLASARVGAFRTSTEAYDWTLQGFKGGVTIPPLPAPR